MNLRDKNILLTGASGGIGREVALALAKAGARIGLLGRREAPLQQLQAEIAALNGVSMPIVADLSDSAQRAHAVKIMEQHIGPIDVLINNAGLVDFHDFSEQSPAIIERMIETNVLAPMLLTHSVLPNMLQRRSGRIVNIGSTFGSIGFAYFAAYASSKFAVRGFSESLRRELKGSGVGVSYLAPRAVKTSANSEAVYRMAAATRMNMDEPVDVARFIVQSIKHDKDIAYFGWPEKLFVRINALLPGLVDAAVRKQTQIMARFAPKAH